MDSSGHATIFDLVPGLASAHDLCMKHLFRSTLLHFLRDEQGQDLIEYTLLMAFIALASMSIMVTLSGSTTGIWKSANNQLSNAVIAAS